MAHTGARDLDDVANNAIRHQPLEFAVTMTERKPGLGEEAAHSLIADHAELDVELGESALLGPPRSLKIDKSKFDRIKASNDSRN